MDSPRPRLPGPRPGHWVAIDCACTALVLLLNAVVFRDMARLPEVPDWARAVLAVAAVLPVAFRRWRPVAALTVAVVAGAVLSALSVSPVPPIAVALVMYLIPLRYSRRDALWLVAGALASMTAGLAAFAATRHGIYGAGGAANAVRLLVEGGLLVTGAWVLGYLMRQQRAYSDGLREQAVLRAREELAQARRAATQERLRIARELHDVVAHSLSLIAVQAGVAHYVGSTQPDEAGRALSSIEEISRGAMQEMRALLGVLRADDGDGLPDGQPAAARGPAPGLAELDRLAARAAKAGVTVELIISGQRAALSAGLDLAAYRIIQEAITNVIKHAATPCCRVSLDYQPAALTLEITDRGAGPRTGSGAQYGHGLTGMRERVGMYGGEFAAAPLPHGGFGVFASLPLTGQTQ